MNLGKRASQLVVLLLFALFAISTYVLFHDIHLVTDQTYLMFLCIDYGSAVISILFAGVLITDRSHDPRNVAFRNIMLLIALTFLSHAFFIYCWKGLHDGDTAFAFLSCECCLMMFVLLDMVVGLKAFLPGNERIHRYYVLASGLLAILQVAYILYNVFTHSLWYFDGDVLVKTPLYITSFILPMVSNAVFIIAALHVSRISNAGSLLALLMTASLLVVSMSHPYQATIHFVAVLYPLLILMPFLYRQNGKELSVKRNRIRVQNEAVVSSRLDEEEIALIISNLRNLDYMPPAAKEALEKLGTYMCDNIGSLEGSSLIPLSKEMENVEAYLYLQKLRYKDRLSIEYDITNTDVPVPSLCIQVLVENAVKHGISKRREGGSLSVSTSVDDGILVIRVNDDGVGFDINAPRSTDRSHVGMDNLRERLDSIGGSLDIDSEPGIGTKATVRVPILQQ